MKILGKSIDPLSIATLFLIAYAAHTIAYSSNSSFKFFFFILLYLIITIIMSYFFPNIWADEEDEIDVNNKRNID